VAIRGGDNYGFMGKGTSEFLSRDNWFFTSDISKLEQRKMDAFISISCNTGTQNLGDSNMATLMMINQPGIGMGIAADGSVTVGISTSGWWILARNPCRYKQ